MKEIIFKIASFLMAFTVLFSTFSFTVNEHYCGDNLKDRAIVFKADKCDMESQMAKTKGQCSITKKKCCEDVVNLVEGQDELKVSFEKLAFDEKILLASYIITYVDLFEGLEEKTTAFSEYPPPLLVRPIYKLDETYLI